MTAAYTTLYDETLPDVPGVPQNVALNAIRNAVIEFCDRSKIWVVDHAAVTTVANQAAYAFAPPAGSVVCAIITAWFSGLEIFPTTHTDLKNEYRNWPSLPGTPLRYLQESEEGLILFPYPSSAIVDALTMKVALKPTRASTTVEGWILEKYREEIAHGAKGKLFAMQKKPWTDAGLASFHGGMFDAGISKARLHAAKSLGRAPLRTKAQFI